LYIKQGKARDFHKLDESLKGNVLIGDALAWFDTRCAMTYTSKKEREKL